MTQNKAFKRLVRDRQARTGESYMTAMRHVRAASPEASDPDGVPQIDVPPIDVIELLDLSELADELGLRCQVSMFRELADEVEPRDLLTQLRGSLDRADLAVMRGALLDGVLPKQPIDFRLAVAVAWQDGPGVSLDGLMAKLWIGGRHQPVLVRFGLTAPPLYARASLPVRLVIGDPKIWRLR